MQISPFPLPSNYKKVIHFRVPTVDDALLFCELDESQEEIATTQFLNHVQETDKQGGKLHDAVNWTGEDRRTALWWIFISTQDDPSVSVSYECEHCQQEHYVTLSLPDLAETSTVLKSRPEHKIDITIAGKTVSGVTVSPMRGYACEALEMLRNERDSFKPGSLDYRKANKAFVLNELAHCLSFPEQPDDQEDALEYKLSQIKLMALDTEFRALAAKVELLLREMRHGLLTQYDKGRFTLVVRHDLQCEKAKEAQEGTSKILLLPFRNYDYIPVL